MTQGANELVSPHQRADQIGRVQVEAELTATSAEGALSHGWIIAGPRGCGKATLAYRIARGMLDPSALKEPASFQIDPSERVFRLIAGGAHPDLFVAERAWDEKKSRYKTEISVETIRKLIQFLNRTASGSGYRVAIIDTADDMNRNAANALLKALEEPPQKALLLLLANAPGRLIATVRSRCKRIDLRAVPDAEMIAFLQKEGVSSAKTAPVIAAHAGGRPGYALKLAAGEGAESIELANKFLLAARRRGAVTKVAGALTGKAGDERWEIFKEVLTSSLTDGARAAASGIRLEGPLAGASVAGLIDASEKVNAMLVRGEALNLDRSQLLGAVAYDLRAAFAEHAV